MTFDEWFDSKRGELRPPRLIDALRECWEAAQKAALDEQKADQENSNG